MGYADYILIISTLLTYLAEREGFEPSIRVLPV